MLLIPIRNRKCQVMNIHKFSRSFYVIFAYKAIDGLTVKEENTELLCLGVENRILFIKITYFYCNRIRLLFKGMALLISQRHGVEFRYASHNVSKNWEIECLNSMFPLPALLLQ